MISVRQASVDDAAALSAVLNEIIRIGGTTAHEDKFSSETFAKYFVTGPDALCCFMAADEKGEALGFQTLNRDTRLPEGWADIGTFARASNKVKGVGTVLLPHTLAFARSQGYSHIHAIIRADNVPGLGYYAKMGFEDYKVWKDVPLKSGLKVDRNARLFTL